MKQEKVFIIGDVHGCFKEFLALLKKANYKPKKHRLILVGDVINRGPHSLELLKWLKKNNIELVRGNHEQSFIRGVKNSGLLNPVLKQLKKDMKGKLNQWIDFLEALPFYIEGEDFLVVHGGLVPQEEPKYSDPHLLMNIRTWDGIGQDIKSEANPPWYQFYKGQKTVVYGHWAHQGLKLRKNSIGLDSGCVYGGSLSGVFLPERKIIQVSAFKNYYSRL